MFLSRIFLSTILTFVPVQHYSQPSAHQEVNPWAAGNQALQRVVDYSHAIEDAKGVQYLRLVAAENERQKEATQPVAPTVTVSNSDTPATNDAFLACTRGHESDSAGGYGAVSAGGTYRGAYQFDQSTWNSVATSSGRLDLVGADPATASSKDQDTLAINLHNARGNQPWGGRC